MSKKVDMGEYLKPGTNELRVEVVSNLANIKSSYTQRFGIVGRGKAYALPPSAASGGE